MNNELSDQGQRGKRKARKVNVYKRDTDADICNKGSASDLSVNLEGYMIDQIQRRALRKAMNKKERTPQFP